MEGMSTKEFLNGQDLSTVFVDDLLANNKSEDSTGKTPEAGSGTAVAEEIPDLEDILKEEKAKADRTRGERPRTERSRIDRSKGDRPKVERLKFERPREDRSVEERPRGERLREDRPRVERLREDRPKVERLKEGRPRPDSVRDERPRPERRPVSADTTPNTKAASNSSDDVDAMMEAIRAKKDALGVRYPKIFAGSVAENPEEGQAKPEAPVNEVQEEKERIPVVNTSFGKMSEALRGTAIEEGEEPAKEIPVENVSEPVSRPSFEEDIFAEIPSEVVDILSDDADDEENISTGDVVMTTMAAAQATAKEIPARRAAAPVERPVEKAKEPDPVDKMAVEVANILSQKQVNVDSMVAAAEAQAEAAAIENEFKESVEEVKTSASFDEKTEDSKTGSQDLDAINAARAAAARARIASFKTAAVRAEVPVTAKTPKEIPVVSSDDIEEMNATREAAEGPIAGDSDIDAMIAAMAEEDAIVNNAPLEAPETEETDMDAMIDAMEDISESEMSMVDDDIIEDTFEEETIDINDIPVKNFDAGESDMDAMIAAMAAEDAVIKDDDDFAMDEEPMSEAFEDDFSDADMRAAMKSSSDNKVELEPYDLPLTGELEELMVDGAEGMEETGLSVVEQPESASGNDGVADAITGGINDIKKFLEAEDYEFTVVSAGTNDMILLKVEDGSAMIITYENGELESLEDGYTRKGMTSYNDIANSYLKETIVSKGRKVMKRHKGTRVVTR